MVNDGYTGALYDYFSPDQNLWAVESTDEPLLWAEASGDGLAGTYSRPSEYNWAPYDYMGADSGGLKLFAGDDSGEGIGLTAGGATVQCLEAYGLDIIGMSYANTSFVNPATWLEDYVGIHGVQSGGSIYIYADGDYLYFTPTSVTIAAIPEPAAVTTTILTALAALFIHRRCRATLPRR